MKGREVGYKMLLNERNFICYPQKGQTMAGWKTRRSSGEEGGDSQREGRATREAE